MRIFYGNNGCIFENISCSQIISSTHLYIITSSAIVYRSTTATAAWLVNGCCTTTVITNSWSRAITRYLLRICINNIINCSISIKVTRQLNIIKVKSIIISQCRSAFIFLLFKNYRICCFICSIIFGNFIYKLILITIRIFRIFNEILFKLRAICIYYDIRKNFILDKAYSIYIRLFF